MQAMLEIFGDKVSRLLFISARQADCRSSLAQARFKDAPGASAMHDSDEQEPLTAHLAQQVCKVSL